MTFFQRRQEPAMTQLGVYQNHQHIVETRILDVGVLAVACGLLCPLEHTVHLVEVEIAEQWRDHPALRNAISTVGFQHNLQQVQHVIIVDSFRYLAQQSVVPNVVKVAPQINIYDACLLLNDCLRHAVDRFMSCLLVTIAKRSRLEVGLKDRLQDELDLSLHHPIPDCRNRKDADFSPVLRYFPSPSRKWFIGALNEFVPDLLEESVYASRLDGFEGDPIYAGSTVVFFGQRVRLA